MASRRLNYWAFLRVPHLEEYGSTADFGCWRRWRFWLPERYSTVRSLVMDLRKLWWLDGQGRQRFGIEQFNDDLIPSV